MRGHTAGVEPPCPRGRTVRGRPTKEVGGRQVDAAVDEACNASTELRRRIDYRELLEHGGETERYGGDNQADKLGDDG